MPHDGVSDSLMFAPFAGMIRIRFGGCDLSPCRAPRCVSQPSVFWTRSHSVSSRQTRRAARKTIAGTTQTATLYTQICAV